MRRRFLLASLLGVAAVIAWVGTTWTCTPGVARINVSSATAPTSAPALEDPLSVYALRDSEVIRHISQPDPDVRQALLQKLHFGSGQPVYSLTLMWNGELHIKSVGIGEPPLPPTLTEVLTYSLGIPTYILDGLGAGREIRVGGDWVIRAGADPASYLPYVAEVVRKSGHPKFAFLRQEGRLTTYTVEGTPCPTTEILQLFPPSPGLEEEAPQTGTVDDFLRALSKAIGRPIESKPQPQDASRLTWRDNSPAYHQLGSGPTEEMIRALLESTASILHVRFERVERPTVVWRLSDSGD
jgi:hypothetical protein